MEKIKAKQIWLRRAEGYPHECKDFTFKDKDCWAKARRQLGFWSMTAPKDGSYHKCDYEIIYEDGTVRRGRYDLQHPSMLGYPSLAEDFRKENEFYAGIYCPPGFSKRQYEEFVNQHNKVKQYKDFLGKYEIGPEF